MQADAAEIEVKPAAVARRVRLLSIDHLDGRTRAARRALEIRDGIEADLGGRDHLTVAQRLLTDHAAAQGAMLEDVAARGLAGKPIDMTDYHAGINSLRRVLVTLGLARRARDVSPTLAGYLAQAHRNAAQGDDGGEVG